MPSFLSASLFQCPSTFHSLCESLSLTQFLSLTFPLTPSAPSGLFLFPSFPPCLSWDVSFCYSVSYPCLSFLPYFFSASRCLSLPPFLATPVLQIPRRLGQWSTPRLTFWASPGTEISLVRARGCAGGCPCVGFRGVEGLNEGLKGQSPGSALPRTRAHRVCWQQKLRAPLPSLCYLATIS